MSFKRNPLRKPLIDKSKGYSLRGNPINKPKNAKAAKIEKDIGKLLQIDKTMVEVKGIATTTTTITIKLPASANINKNLESEILKKTRSLMKGSTLKKATVNTVGSNLVFEVTFETDPRNSTKDVINPK